MIDDSLRAENEKSRAAWNANAAFWNERMGGDGNRLPRNVLWPATERLLGARAGEQILDAACGNGVYARLIAAKGASVVAFDFAGSMVELARERGTPAAGAIDYQVADATDQSAVEALGDAKSFDVALCSMALMDMPVIEPLMRSAYTLLRPGGRFVWSIMHPAFNQSRATRLAEERYEPRQHEASALVTDYSMRISGYLTPIVSYGSAIVGQAREQPYFERPLQHYLAAAFNAGFVLDAFEEPPFPTEGEAAGWDIMRTELPMVVVARLRSL
jgi:2-polyprenyl-3-methyl-5-hydroxy-6-metoxy-1,4-benzoquinol methylase